MKFKPGDICINPPSWRAGCWLIAAIMPDNYSAPYDGVSLINKGRYSLREEGLVKIGEIAAELKLQQVVDLLLKPPPFPAETSPEFLEGKARAEEYAVIGWPEVKKQWAFLAQAKPGDRILISLGTKPEMVTFHHVLAKGDKYVFAAANRKGKIYRYPLDVLVLEP
jgi:hypothetical protein